MGKKTRMTGARALIESLYAEISITFWSGMSRLQHMRQTDMPVPQVKLEYVWQLPDLEPPTWLQA